MIKDISNNRNKKKCIRISTNFYKPSSQRMDHLLFLWLKSEKEEYNVCCDKICKRNLKTGYDSVRKVIIKPYLGLDYQVEMVKCGSRSHFLCEFVRNTSMRWVWALIPTWSLLMFNTPSQCLEFTCQFIITSNHFSYGVYLQFVLNDYAEFDRENCCHYKLHKLGILSVFQEVAPWPPLVAEIDDKKTITQLSTIFQFYCGIVAKFELTTLIVKGTTCKGSWNPPTIRSRPQRLLKSKSTEIDQYILLTLG